MSLGIEHELVGMVCLDLVGSVLETVLARRFQMLLDGS